MNVRHAAWRLEPEEDLGRGLEARLGGEDYAAGWVVAVVGSLCEARLRYADQPESTLVGGPLELVSLSGTLSPDGVHLHASVADQSGRMRGGHLGYGCRVRTTVEIVCALSSAPGLVFRRVHDERTGFRELRIGDA